MRAASADPKAPTRDGFSLFISLFSLLRSPKKARSLTQRGAEHSKIHPTLGPSGVSISRREGVMRSHQATR